jgi:hypothetical protein
MYAGTQSRYMAAPARPDQPQPSTARAGATFGVGRSGMSFSGGLNPNISFESDASLKASIGGGPKAKAVPESAGGRGRSTTWRGGK